MIAELRVGHYVDKHPELCDFSALPVLYLT
jgi:hypothetical protein